MELHLPGDPKKTEEYKTRLDASFVRASGGDDQSLRHHRPTIKKREKIQNVLEFCSITFNGYWKIMHNDVVALVTENILQMKS